MAEAQPKQEEIDPDLQRVLERFQKSVEQQNTSVGAETRSEQQPATAKIIQLPLWPERVRGTPNTFLRSALFPAIQGKTRRYLEKELLAATGGITLRFTGKQLDQSDLDVWELAVHLSREHPVGNVCFFTGYA